MHLLVTSPALLSALTVSQASVHFAAKNRNSELRQLILSEKSEIVSQESSTVCGEHLDVLVDIKLMRFQLQIRTV